MLSYVHVTMLLRHVTNEYKMSKMH